MYRGMVEIEKCIYVYKMKLYLIRLISHANFAQRYRLIFAYQQLEKDLL